MFGPRGRIGIVVPANNSVLEPELWSRLPDGVALYATRILARGRLTPEAVRRMEGALDRAVEELAATVVDAIVYADMVTTFLMEDGWSEARTRAIADRTGAACLSAWTALRDALDALGVTRFALGTPYPAAIHALCRPFFEERGYRLTDDATLDIEAMADVPRVSSARLRALVEGLDRSDAEAIVLLATDLPTFDALDALERDAGLPVVSSNQAILWSALGAVGAARPVAGPGALFSRPSRPPGLASAPPG